MSSANLIREVLSTGDKVHKIWNYFTDAPPEYAPLSRELHSFYIAVSDLVNQTARIKILVEREDGNATKSKQLKGICDTALSTLTDVEKFIKKNKPPDDASDRTTPPTPNKSGSRGGHAHPPRTPRTWRRHGDATNIYDLARLKQLLLLNYAAIMDFRSSLAAAVQNRPGNERHDFLATAIYELMAGAVAVDADGEGSRNSAQTPAPVAREKVLAIWTDYMVPENLAAMHQAEIDARLEELHSNSTRQSKKKLDDEPTVSSNGAPNGGSSSLRRSSSIAQLRRKISKANIAEREPPPPPMPGQMRKPLTILLDDRTQSHVGVLFAHHLRQTLNPSPSSSHHHDAYAASVLNLELCTSPSSLLMYTPATDSKLAASFLRHGSSPLTWRRSLYRPRSPPPASALATYDLIILAGYDGNVPIQYAATPPNNSRSPQGTLPAAIRTAEIVQLEDYAGGLRKFSNPLTRSLTNMSSRAAWDRAEKEVVRAVTDLVASKIKSGSKTF